MSDLTPFQPSGPYFHVMLRGAPNGATSLVSAQTRGERIVLEGSVFDGSGAPMTDALVEIWQADADGVYQSSFLGYGRVATDPRGTFRFETIKPGAVPVELKQAPHVLIGLLAPGILTRYWTRVYFEDEPSNACDPVLQLVPPDRRSTLLAHRLAPGHYRFDVRVQGPGETVFFEA